jgi:integrase/recombinase XerD
MESTKVLTEVINSLTLSDAIDEFTLEMKLSGKHTKKTQIYYEQHFRYFKGNAPKYLKEITPAVVLKHLEIMEAGKMLRGGVVKQAPYVKQGAYRALKAFFNWCVDPKRQLITSNPVNFKIGKPDDKVHMPPTKEQIRLLIDSFDDSFLGKRNKALLMLYANTGCRLSELLADFKNDRTGIKDGDIHWNEAKITVFGKGRIEREPGLSPNTVKALFAYKAAMFKRFPVKTTTAFFVTEEGTPLQGAGFRQVIDNHCKLLGFHFSPHDFRRYVVTSSVEAGIPERMIMETTGHKNRHMIDVYSKTVHASKARELMEKHSPVAGL